MGEFEDEHRLAQQYFQRAMDGDRDRLNDAIDLMKSVAERREEVLGLAHQDTLESWSSLDLFRNYADRPDIPNLTDHINSGWEQLVAARVREFGPDAPETQFARMRLASAYFAGARRQEQLAVLADVNASFGRLVEERTRELGPVHPDTVDARERYAWSFTPLGRKDRELELLAELLADLERLLGDRDPLTLRSQIDWASTLTGGARDLPGAIALCERIFETARSVLGEDDENFEKLERTLLYARDLLARGYGR